MPNNKLAILLKVTLAPVVSTFILPWLCFCAVLRNSLLGIERCGLNVFLLTVNSEYHQFNCNNVL